jgi:hypothetical protein
MAGLFSGPPEQGGSMSKTFFRSGDEQLINNAQGLLNYDTGVARQAANRAAGQYNTNFEQFTPKLNTEFRGPQFNNNLDAYSQQIISQGQNAAANQVAAQQQQIQRQVAPKNPMAAAILAQQAGQRSAMSMNPMLFQAAGQQRDRQVQEYQLGNQAQASTNAARAQQGQLNADFRGLQNAALGQQAQLAAAPAQMSQSLLSILTALGMARGTSATAVAEDGNNSLLLEKIFGIPAARLKNG